MASSGTRARLGGTFRQTSAAIAVPSQHSLPTQLSLVLLSREGMLRNANPDSRRGTHSLAGGSPG